LIESGVAAACQNEMVAALKTIANIATLKREGQMLSWRDRVGEAARIADEAINKIASVEISPPQIIQRQESYDQGMGW